MSFSEYLQYFVNTSNEQISNEHITILFQDDVRFATPNIIIFQNYTYKIIQLSCKINKQYKDHKKKSSCINYQIFVVFYVNQNPAFFIQHLSSGKHIYVSYQVESTKNYSCNILITTIESQQFLLLDQDLFSQSLLYYKNFNELFTWNQKLNARKFQQYKSSIYKYPSCVNSTVYYYYNYFYSIGQTNTHATSVNLLSILVTVYMKLIYFALKFLISLGSVKPKKNLLYLYINGVGLF
eukprot:TRINITY_DN6774_c0_g1_i14.p1 TRINITY_DN6774_c0_g1~~TRINITY_DN6774_c0_g1_i14.p1  ORF type:complete len:238 (-),score=-16.23 TRINITY_DN6774_c0_g1_i14:257-970(-)